MQIRLGYELNYNLPQTTPMMLALSIHYSRASDMIIPDHLVADPRRKTGHSEDGDPSSLRRVSFLRCRYSSYEGCHTQARQPSAR
jgi:hypothetical protein